MKKIITLLFVSLPLLVAAQNTDLKSHVDTVNYLFGMANGGAIRVNVIGADTADQSKMQLFCNGFNKAWGVTEGGQYNDIVGFCAGASLAKESASGFLFNDSTIPAKRDLIMKTFENSIRKSPFIMDKDGAIKYLQDKVFSKMEKRLPANPTPAQIDTINMCIGFLNADQALSSTLQKSTSVKEFDAYIAAFRKGYAMNIKDEPLLNGMNIALQFTNNLKRDDNLLGEPSLTINWSLVGKGALDGILAKKSFMTAQNAGNYLDNMMKDIQEKRNAPLKEAGAKFLAENVKDKDVHTTVSGLQYKVITQGNGPKPIATSKVRVHYTGKLIDGKVFDSSVERGEPIEFELGRVIRGWQEGLQLMPVGSKYILYIPYNLGYGERGAGQQIPPYATLIFEVELLDIIK